MRSREASWLIQLLYGDPKYSFFKSYLKGCNTAEIIVLFHYNFLVQCQTRVWISWRFNHPKISILSSIDALHGGKNFYASRYSELQNFAKTLISSREEGEGVSPCAIFLNQDSSNTMLRFHMLDYISLVFNPNSQQ